MIPIIDLLGLPSLLLPRIFGFFQTPFPPCTFNNVAVSIVSGKTIIIATTEGNVSIPGAEDKKIGLNVYRKK